MRSVEAYGRACRAGDDHPVIAATPARWSLDIWSVVLRSEGHQIPHVHPAGWISGVYYPMVPDVISDAGDGHDGWIEFGRPPDKYGVADPDIRLFRPEPGLMLLFPSYVYHRTIPFDGDGTRISIAFDVLPSA